MAEPVRLKNIAAFREALRDYQVSAHAQSVLDQSRLVVLVGLAGGGRNTTINYLVQHHNFFFLVSDTTRPPKMRDGRMEQDGVHYYFRREEDMLRDIQAGEFIEAEIIHSQQVSGTSIRELKRANKTNRIAIHDYEYGGAHNIAMAKPDSYVIGLLPPDFDEWLRRLTTREEIHSEEFSNRLRTAEKVLRNMLAEPYFKLVINRTVEQCARDIVAIVEGKVDVAAQSEAKAVARELLRQVEEQLKLAKI